MQRLITTLFICFSFFSIQGQDFSIVDTRVKQYPRSYPNSNALARQIEADFTKDIDKARAIYTWLAVNVSYDLESLYQGQTSINFSYTDQEDLKRKLRAINTNTVNKTLRSKKAICEGYAQTFKKVAEQLGIPCMLVGGFSKGDVSDIGVIPREENHAWNAFKVDGNWYLVDATWGAGYTNGSRWIPRFNDFFFMTDPEQFALTHFPTDSMWFLGAKSQSKQAFYKSPVFENAYFEYGIKLKTPTKGVLNLEPGSNIQFTLDSIREGITLYYVFKEDKFSERIEPTCTNGLCTFNIPFTKERNTELIIFANKRSILQYKIKVRQ